MCAPEGDLELDPILSQAPFQPQRQNRVCDSMFFKILARGDDNLLARSALASPTGQRFRKFHAQRHLSAPG